MECGEADIQNHKNGNTGIDAWKSSGEFSELNESSRIRSILVITPHYLTFVKDYCEVLAKNIDGEIHVLIHYNPLMIIARYLQVGYLKYLSRFTIDNLVDRNNIPPNVHVHAIKHVYFIPDSKNIKLGEKLFNRFITYIKKKKSNLT